LNSQRNTNFSGSFQPFVLIMKKLVIFVHFKGFNTKYFLKSRLVDKIADNYSLVFIIFIKKNFGQLKD
jgi:hypothetical protein